jgi:hypothetical protein
MFSFSAVAAIALVFGVVVFIDPPVVFSDCICRQEGATIRCDLYSVARSLRTAMIRCPAAKRLHWYSERGLPRDLAGRFDIVSAPYTVFLKNLLTFYLASIVVVVIYDEVFISISS